jgi:uncharacterized protein (DUF1810 family)
MPLLGICPEQKRAPHRGWDCHRIGLTSCAGRRFFYLGVVADPFDLARFLDAQAGCYAAALAEIRAGRKQSHWMWFVFPQLAGLGRSEMARHYAIASLAMAEAYLAHPVLGARLREAVEALESLTGTTAERVFGAVDAMKLRSSLTLFARAGGGAPFDAVLGRWFGSEDPRTVALLAQC